MSRPSSAPSAYWAQAPEALLSEIGASTEGLTSREAAARLARFGPNTLDPPRGGTALGLFLGQFKSAIVLILLAATAVSAATGDWTDALIILAIVLGSATLGFYQERRANDAVQELRSRVQSRADVRRDGATKTIPVREVVPGDVVLLSAGSLIPADGILLEARDLFVDQAALTGETYPVEKQPGVVAPSASLAERTNCIFMGTSVRSGIARALIIATGPGTHFGQIAGRLIVRAPETDFERGVRHFGYLLAQVMFALVLIVFAANVWTREPVLEALLFSVALAVGLTPQLLPAIVTITLAQGSRHMAAKGVIVRRLNAIENFGSMDILCTDKTGTLTEGVVELDGALTPEGQTSEEVFRLAYLNAHLQSGLANPLDQAVQSRAAPDVTGVTKVDEVPFDFERKRLSVAVRENGQTLLVTKGAVESVLAVCSSTRTGETRAALALPQRQALMRRFSDWSSQGYRVLGLAMAPLDHAGSLTRNDERDMTFVGFLLFSDPPKGGVREAIASLARLGVQLKVITGDNRLVARHLAEQVGLAVEGAVTGTEIGAMPDEALWHTVEHCTLFTEVDPNEKERIILALKKRGHVVGYMGDGINDAPALHAADVSISVDGAVDVAKEAADLVLMQRDLDVLREGIEQGRRTFANTLKYVFITTSANFGNMFSMAGASLLLPFLPMLPKQILLTNFLTDLPAMGIATDSVDRELVERPHRWNVAFIRSFMVTFGVVSSLFDYLTFGVLLWVVRASRAQFQTGWYLESTLTELLILLTIRTQRPFFRSKPGRALSLGVAAVALITAILPFTPLRQVLGMALLPPDILLPLAGIALLYIALTEVVKRVFYRHAHL